MGERPEEMPHQRRCTDAKKPMERCCASQAIRKTQTVSYQRTPVGRTTGWNTGDARCGAHGAAGSPSLLGGAKWGALGRQHGGFPQN